MWPLYSSRLRLELLLIFIISIWPLICIGAPLQESSTDLQHYPEGCYYNYNHYNEGDRILTNEPCLNCTCHNKMLMCYLRVCPFTKPIGHDCVVEKREDQCCPIITCPEVPVELIDHQGQNTEVGYVHNYGCEIEGNFYPEGAQVPSNPNKPCELCYCIRNRTSCIMQECTLHVDGCQPIYNRGSCCPVRYNCDYEQENELALNETTTTVKPTPGFLLTTTLSPAAGTECVHEKSIYVDGALIPSEQPCEHCYCMRGDIVCAVQDCEIPLQNEGRNCTFVRTDKDECCPKTYACNDITETTVKITDITAELEEKLNKVTTSYKLSLEESHTTTSTYDSEKEEKTTIKPLDIEQDLHETISEEDLQLQGHIDDVHNIVDKLNKEDGSHLTTTEKLLVKTTSISEVFAQDDDFVVIKTEKSPKKETTTIFPSGYSKEDEIYSITQPIEEDQIYSTEHTTFKQEDLDKDEDVETSTSKLLPSDISLTEQGTGSPMDQEVSTEGSRIDTYHHRLQEEDITELPPSVDENEIIPISIPGEGDCLVNEITYKNNSNVPSENKCDINCLCVSSVVICKNIKCEAPPSDTCKVTKVTSSECCPLYNCQDEENEKVNASQSFEKLFENAVTEKEFTDHETTEGILFHTTESYFTKSLTKDYTQEVTTDRPEVFYTETKNYETESYTSESFTRAHDDGIIFSTTESILDEGIKKSPYDSKESDITTQFPFASSHSQIGEDINKIEDNEENEVRSVSSEGPITPTKDSRLVQDNLESTTTIYSNSESVTSFSGSTESYGNMDDKFELHSNEPTEKPEYAAEEIINRYESHTDFNIDSEIEVTSITSTAEGEKEEFMTPSSVIVKDGNIFTEDTTPASSLNSKTTEEKEQALEHDETISLDEENLFIATTIRPIENATTLIGTEVKKEENNDILMLNSFDETIPMTESSQNIATKQPEETYVETTTGKIGNLDNSLKTSTLSSKDDANDIEDSTQTAIMPDSVTKINEVEIEELNSDLHSITSTTEKTDVEDITDQQLGYNEETKLEGYDLKTEKYDSDTSYEEITKIPVVNSETSEHEQSRYPTISSSPIYDNEKQSEETYSDEKKIYQTSSSESIHDKHEQGQKIAHEESFTETIVYQTSVKLQAGSGTEQSIPSFNEYTTKHQGLESDNSIIAKEPELFIETTSDVVEREDVDDTSTTTGVIKDSSTEEAHIENLPTDKLEESTEIYQTTEILKSPDAPYKVVDVLTTITPKEETKPSYEAGYHTSTRPELNELIPTKLHEDQINLQEDSIDSATEIGTSEYTNTATESHSVTTMSQQTVDNSNIHSDIDSSSLLSNGNTIIADGKQTTDAISTDGQTDQQDSTTPKSEPIVETFTEGPIHEVGETTAINLEEIEKPNYNDEQDLELAAERVTLPDLEVSINATSESDTNNPIILENEAIEKKQTSIPTIDFSDISELNTSTKKNPGEPEIENQPENTPKYTTTDHEYISTEGPYRPINKTKPEQMGPNTSTTHPAYPPGYGQLAPHYPTYPEEDYAEEDESEVFGPGTCRYGGKLFVSAQQIPRDDPCDFCFCFRSDIICLQQSCPPPISGCHEEPIQGFCCPRYECPVSMATALNVTTSTTTTSTTLPPHFLHRAQSEGSIVKNGCHIQGQSYKVGEKIESTSGPCMHCKCGGDGQMKCEPFKCTPEPMLRQMIAVVASRRR